MTDRGGRIRHCCRTCRYADKVPGDYSVWCKQHRRDNAWHRLTDLYVARVEAGRYDCELWRTRAGRPPRGKTMFQLADEASVFPSQLDRHVSRVRAGRPGSPLPPACDDAPRD